MKYTLILCAVVNICIHINAQENKDAKFMQIDFVQIKQKASNRELYDQLITRFIACDSTLVMEDQALIYYGYSFQPEYQGSLQDVIYANSIQNFIKEKKYNEAIEYCIHVLDKENPVNLRMGETLAFLVYNYDYESGNKSKYIPYFKRFSAIIHTIARSGDGSKANPYVVISIADEYAFMQSIGISKENIKDQSLIEDSQPLKRYYDVFTIHQEEKEYELWFDISRSYLQMEDNL